MTFQFRPDLCEQFGHLLVVTSQIFLEPEAKVLGESRDFRSDSNGDRTLSDNRWNHNIPHTIHFIYQILLVLRPPAQYPDSIRNHLWPELR